MFIKKHHPNRDEDMKDAKILILGAYGMLGHKLFQSLGRQYEAYATCRSVRPDLNETHNLDSDRLFPNVTAENFDSVVSALSRICPDVVINCIGIIKQREQSGEAIASLQINAVFPRRLASLCKSAKTRLFHFGTDCVFSGKRGMYTERDIPDAEDLYGRTKYLGEVSDEGCITIRSSIIGREIAGREGLLEWFLSNKGGSVKGFTKAIYSGFTTTEMSRIVNLIITNHTDLYGVWHVASKPISKFDLLHLVNSKLSLGITIRPDDTFRCDRSLNGDGFNQRTGYCPPSWDEMIDELSKESI